MLKVRDVALPETAHKQLKQWQAQIDAKPDYVTRVEDADRTFGNRNRGDNPTFMIVRATLATMCPGVKRCHYCEDSLADEVEHIRPKKFYPEAVFSWENYLYACGPCNGSKKSDKFALFSDLTGQIVNLKRNDGDPIVQPEAGQMLWLDLRTEDPLDFMQLDIFTDYATFQFTPRHEENTKEFIRADYTIRELDLNADILCAARKSAYVSYFAQLDVYIRDKRRGVDQARLDQWTDAIRKNSHTTVWKEMQRSYHVVSELKMLFEQAPEALDW